MHRVLYTIARRLGPFPVSSSRVAVAARERRFVTTSTTPEEFADRCSLHIVKSPFPSIADGPYPPLYEFISENWLPHGGYLDEKVAIIDGSTGMRRTFRDYYSTTGGLAGALRYDFDVKENDCVAVW